MYRDFQENTLNSDGSFAMWIMFLSAIYCVHVLYNYMIPWYWYKNDTMKNGEEQRLRMRDALCSTVLEGLYGFQIAEWGYTPHQYHFERRRLFRNYSHPDDVRLMHMGTLNRKHRYREHYIKRAGDDQKTMTSI
jgi:hypothetical protein